MKKRVIPGNLLDKEVENLDDHGCTKIWDLVDPKIHKRNVDLLGLTTLLYRAELNEKFVGN